MSLHRRILAALIALVFIGLAPAIAASTLDRAVCSTADRAGGNPAVCEGTELIDSASQEISKLYGGTALVATSVSGTNAITASSSPAPTALVDGMRLRVKPAVTNTSTATFNYGGLGAKPVVSGSGTALTAGDLQSTSLYDFTYYAPNDEWRVTTPLGTGVASASNPFVTVGNTGALSAERALAAGTALGMADGGANGNVTISLTDADLTCIAALATVSDKIPYYTGTGTCALADFSSAIRTLITTPSSANLAALLSDETGSGAVVFSTSPSLTTPVLGAATATTINKVTITAPATAATLTIPDGVTFTGPAASGTAMTLGNNETVTGVKTFGGPSNTGKLAVAGFTSGSTVIAALANASGTVTLPAATTTLVGVDTTNTLTNKTFDTAGTGNTLLINGVSVTANTGTGAVVRQSSPSLTTPAIGSGGATFAGSTSGTTTVAASPVASGTVTLPTATDTLVGKATTDTFTNKTFDTAGTGNSLSIAGVTVTANTGTGAMVRQTSPSLTTPSIGSGGANFTGSTSGTTTLAASAVAGTTALTLPAATDTLVARATTDTLSNKTISGASNTLTNIGNASLTNSATTVNSQTCTLGSTCTVTVPVSTGITGLGTGVASALGVNVGTAGAPVVNGGALGTPSSGTLTNATGLPTTGLTGTLQAAQFPALTGECTTSAGSLSTTCIGGTVDAGADPALGADQARFTSNATVPGFLVFEGDTADTFETRVAVTDPTTDRTLTVPNADTVTVQGTTCGGTDKVSGINATTGAVTCSADVGAGSGSAAAFNGSASASFNFNGTTPAAPAGGQNLTVQVTPGSPDQVSAYLPLGSSTTQVLFNDGGSTVAGDADMTWDKTGNTFTLGGTDTEAVIKGVTNEPAAPASGNLTLFTQSLGGKIVPRAKAPTGAAQALQDALWQGAQYLWTTTGATAGLWINTAGAGAGTFTAQNPTTTSLYTAMKRSRWANVVTTANQVLGQRNTDAIFFVGNTAGQGGFFYTARFGFDVWTNGGRLCACLHTATTVVSADPSTIANTVGFIIDAADNGLISFSTRDGTTLNKTSTGFTAVTGKGYEVQMYLPPNSTSISWRILDMNAGTVATGSTSSNLPAANTMLTAGVLASNAALTPVTSIQLGLGKIYVQTDN
jgi:hypothetical protein